MLQTPVPSKRMPEVCNADQLHLKRPSDDLFLKERNFRSPILRFMVLNCSWTVTDLQAE